MYLYLMLKRVLASGTVQASEKLKIRKKRVGYNNVRIRHIMKRDKYEKLISILIVKNPLRSMTRLLEVTGSTSCEQILMRLVSTQVNTWSLIVRRQLHYNHNLFINASPYYCCVSSRLRKVLNINDGGLAISDFNWKSFFLTTFSLTVYQWCSWNN